MAEFETFKLQVSPTMHVPGQWQVTLLESPVVGLSGDKGLTQTHVLRQDLQLLRRGDGWPNLNALRDIGGRVWQSVMTPKAEAAYQAAKSSAGAANKGLRIIVTTVGEEPPEPGVDRVRLGELPLEVMYDASTNEFVAPDLKTPLSRSLHWTQDRNAVKIALPLRILVVTAEPTDQPPVQAALEVAAIQQALAGLTGPAGAIELDVCSHATRLSLGDALRDKRYHVVHFIAHGKFDQAGNDASPRAYICLEDSATHETDAIDADTLSLRFASTGVMLSVFTACQSAAPAPNYPTLDPFPVRAFDGIAQRLLAGTTTDMTAVIAMQFDFETAAAATFSRYFYTALVKPDITLDEAVTLARKEIAVAMGTGHRAWVTPTVYWRCQRGKVFEFEPTRRTLSDATQRQLDLIDNSIRMLRQKIDQIAAEPAEIRPYLEQMRAGAQQEIDQLASRRSELLGDTLRLLGGTVVPGQEIACSVRLRLKAREIVGLVKLAVNLPADGSVTFVGVAAGEDAGGQFPATHILPSAQPRLNVYIHLVPSAREAGEYEVGVLKFRVDVEVKRPMLDLEVLEASVERNGAAVAIESLAAILFVSP
jgi:hypothetical protein